jgi:hypothetical protein
VAAVCPSGLRKTAVSTLRRVDRVLVRGVCLPYRVLFDLDQSGFQNWFWLFGFLLLAAFAYPLYQNRHNLSEDWRKKRWTHIRGTAFAVL